MSEDKSADLLSSNPQPDNVPTGDDKVGDGGVKQHLMQAWQNLAMYVAATEEPEGAAAGMMLLQGLRHLISGENLADIMGGQQQPGQQQNPNDPNAAPQNPNQPQQQPFQQQQQNPGMMQQQQPQAEDPNAAPQGPNQQPQQQSPFGAPQQPQQPQQQQPSGGGTAPKKKAASSGTAPKKKAAAAPKKKPKAKTATAAMEWLLEAAADYGCASCERNFGTESGLRSHLKNVHTAMKES